ncbi:Mss4-like protein [Phycomyces nitens]|nr:Mss4-like protein [Phycomyces nitens]
MAQIVTFKSLSNPLTAIVSDEKNSGDLLCPKESCRCIIMRKNTASLVERDGAKLSLPEQTLPADSAATNETENEETHFWKLKDMMEFENIGFSKTVGTIKYLSCADCDIGPLGYHDTAIEPKEYLVSVKRARYRFS